MFLSHQIAVRPAFGHLDSVEWNCISGWAFDPAQPDAPVTLEIWHDDRRVCEFKADRFRADLLTARYGDGRRHFSLSLPKALFRSVRVVLRVCIAGSGIDLPGSPFVLVNDEKLLDTTLAALDQVVSSMAATREPDELRELASFLLRQFDCVSRRQAALEASSLTNREQFAAMIGGQDVSDILRQAANAVVARYEPLHLRETDKPDVSIVIPVCGKFSYTHRCLTSILQQAPAASIEVIVVDDASSDETIYAGLVLSGGIRIIRNTRNAGFVGSVNTGVAASRGPMVMLLNNDTEVHEGWLDELLGTFRRDPDIGIAGSKLLYPDGRLQEAGGIVWRMGEGWNYGRLADPARPEFCFLRDADYVSGAALMIPRTLWEAVGGLSEEYAPGYYEDADLCFKVRAGGRRVVVQPQSVVTHHEGVTAGTDVSEAGMKRFQSVNQGIFFDRWESGLRRHGMCGDDPYRESERDVLKRALFIDDTVPTPDKDAGSNAALEHMKSLQRLGYKVHFVGSDNMAKITPYTEALERIGIQCHYAPYQWSVEEVFRREPPDFDLVYLHRLTNATKYAAMARQRYPSARIVYNVADLHHLRIEREADIRGDPVLRVRAAATKQAELAALREADHIIVHSSHERDVIAAVIPKAWVTVVPWVVHPQPASLPFEARHDLAFIAGFNHPPNVDAALWLARDIMPLVWAEDPSIQCLLIGSEMPSCVTGLAEAGVRVLGYVPDLAPHLDQLRLTVAPLRFGAGLKGKVLTSFAAGLPCVGTPCAFEGMDLSKALSSLAASDPAAFAANILRVHRDQALNAALATDGLSFIGSRCAPAQVDALLAEAVRASPSEPAQNLFE